MEGEGGGDEMETDQAALTDSKTGGWRDTLEIRMFFCTIKDDATGIRHGGAGMSDFIKMQLHWQGLRVVFFPPSKNSQPSKMCDKLGMCYTFASRQQWRTGS